MLAGIQPAELRRSSATLSLACRALEPLHLLHQKLETPVNGQRQRLKSRHPFVPAAQELLRKSSHLDTNAAQWADHTWSADWQSSSTRLHAFVPDASTKPAGMTLPRPSWVRLNRLRTGVGRYRSNMHKWGLADSAACDCGADEQTADHIILDCPIYRAPSGIQGLKNLDEETITWLLKSCPDI